MKKLADIKGWEECINTVVCGDCLEGMKLIPDKSVDLVITSPPYDNLRDYEGYSFDFEKTAQELKRILKEGGVVVWIVGDATINGSETGTSFKQALYFKEIGLNLHDTMIWHKSVVPITTKRYQPAFEFMFVFTKGSIQTFNGLTTPRKYKDNRTVKKFHRDKSSGELSIGNYHNKSDEVLITNVWEMHNRDVSKHPAIFPLKLANRHLASWSNENNIVLDPFMGSWTTARACKDMNRDFIGFELSEKYCRVGEERLRQEVLF